VPPRIGTSATLKACRISDCLTVTSANKHCYALALLHIDPDAGFLGASRAGGNAKSNEPRRLDSNYSWKAP
jgi:hypothetical protein